MKKNFIQIFLFCGVALMLAAFPVFAQNGAVNEIELNRRPLSDFTDLVIDRLQKNKLVLSDNFLIEVEGQFTKEGKFDRQKTRFVHVEGNEEMVDIAKSAIEAVNESGYLQYLGRLDSNKINLVVAQDNKQIYAIMKIGFDEPRKSKSIYSSLNMAVGIVKQNKNINEDELVLLNGTSVSETDKIVTIRFVIEKSVGQEMIQRNLAEQINKKLKQKTGK
jgi:hypothetical protein